MAAAEAPGVPLRWHFHNTRNTGYANALTAADLAGDAPWRWTPAPAASAAARSPRTPPATSPPRTCSTCCTAAATDTGVDVAALLPLAGRLGALLGHEVPGQLARAGLFPS